MSSITLFWEKRSINHTTNYLNFSKTFKSEPDSQEFHFSRLNPPIKYEKESIEFVVFNNFIFDGSRLTLNLVSLIEFQVTENVTLTILDPPVPIYLNPILNPDFKLNSTMHVHLFYVSVSETVYINTVLANISHVESSIREVILNSSFGKYEIKTGYFEKDGLLPDMHDLESFFTKYPPKKCNLMIAVQSDDEPSLKYKGSTFDIKNIPTSPKNILLRVAHKIHEIQSSMSDSDLRVYRRLMTVCYNGAIPVHLFADVRIPINEGEFLKSEDFERIQIDFSKFPAFRDFLEYLRYPLVNLKTQLVSFNEATLRSLLIDNLFGACFCDLVAFGSDGTSNFRLEQTQLVKIQADWPIKNLDKSLEGRIVDLVATFEGIDSLQNFPLLFVEVRKRPFATAEEHKDFPKLLNLLAVACRKLAFTLQSAGRKPELARIYGIWVGGLDIHFCVAHAVVVKLPDGVSHEIQVNISFPNDWKMNILSESSSTKAGAGNFTPNAVEKLIPGSGNVFPEIIFDSNEFDGFDLDFEDLDFADDDEDGEQNNSAKKVKVLETVVDDPSDTVMKLKLFVECVKHRSSLVKESLSGTLKDSRKFKPVNSVLKHIVPGSASSIHQTPQDKQVKSNYAVHPKGGTSFHITKHSMKELEILQKLSMFPQSFPRMFHYELSLSSEGGNNLPIINYEFETLIPILDRVDGTISPHLYGDTFEESLMAALKFSCHILYSLNLLHSVVGIVHSDISVNNIMFSPMDGTWKVIDFDHSLDIETSLRTNRTAGTNGYRAPESNQLGLFSFASDVFSLGQIIFNVLYPILLKKVENGDEEEENSDYDDDDDDDYMKIRKQQKLQRKQKRKLFLKSFYWFEKVMFKMLSSDPKLRPSVLSALRVLFSFLGKIEIYADLPIHDPLYSCIANHLLLNPPPSSHPRITGISDNCDDDLENQISTAINIIIPSEAKQQQQNKDSNPQQVSSIK